MNSDWADLPEHLLYLVLERLEIYAHFLRFSLVCTTWLHVVKDNAKLVARHQPPMLLIPSDMEDTWNVYNTTNNKVLDLQINLPMKQFCGTSKGWLVLVEKDHSVTLLNPFTRIIGREEKENSIIRLPPIPAYEKNFGCVETIKGFTKAIIVGDPLGDAGDCVVAIIGASSVWFIRLGKDITWSSTPPYRWRIEEVIYNKDAFYGVGIMAGFGAMITCFDTTTSLSNLPFEDILYAPREHSQRYIVDLNDQLIMVQRFMELVSGKLVTKEFRVFELRWDAKREMCDCFEKESLGDAALFLGNMNTVSVPTCSFGGCQPDCIYFNCNNPCLVDPVCCSSYGLYEDFGVYNMKTGCISKPFPRDAMILVEKAKVPPVWVGANASTVKSFIL